MAIFSGKIINVKFFDKAKTVIEVLYKENGEKISYAFEVDWESDDLHDLLKEYSLEDIERYTLKFYKEKQKKKLDKLKSSQAEKPKEKPTGPFDFFQFMEKRYDPGFVFNIKADIFRLRGVNTLSKAKINKIKKSTDALELMYLANLAVKQL